MTLKNGLLVGLTGLLPTLASAASITINDSKDAMIFGTNANTDTGNASGKGPALFAGADSGNTPNRKRSMIEFNVAAAGIPVGATVTGVTMTLYLGMVAGSGGASGTGTTTYSPRTLSLYDLQQDWGEGNSGLTKGQTSPSIGGTGQGYARVTGDSSWDYAFYNAADPSTGKWMNNGVAVHGGNYASTASGSESFPGPYSSASTPASSTAYAFSSGTTGNSEMIPDVQGWLDGTQVNDGWLLRASDALETSSQSFLGFWSREGAAANGDDGTNGSPDIAPQLTITYTLPEPASASMLLGTTLWIASRRTKRASR